MSSPVRLPTEPRHTRELESLLADLDADSLRWVSGFVAGLAAERARGGGAVMPALATVAAEPAQAVVARPRVTVLYASQTGNSRRVAEKLGQAFAAAGVEQRVLASGDYSLRATDGGDYGGKVSGTITFAPGRTVAAVSVPIWPKYHGTPATFRVQLSDVTGSGVVLTRANGTGTIYPASG